MAALRFLIYSVANHQKKRKGTLWGAFLFRKKSHNAEKAERGDPLVSPGTVCYAEKQEKPFWFSSLGQMVQFDTIKFRTTLKKKVTIIVSLHEAPTKNGNMFLIHHQHENNFYA